MRACLLVFSLLIIAARVYSQNIAGADAPDGGYSEGSILLANGMELKGLVRYNDKRGIVSYESGSDSKSFLARNITGFEFADELTGKQRVFYSMEYEDPFTNVPAKQFFEVLRQYKDFAIIGKADPIDVKQKTVTGQSSPWSPGWQGNGGARTKVTIIQTETMYFLSGDSKIEPYLQMTQKDVDKAIGDRSVARTKILDKDIMERFLGAKYESVRQYAKENKLHFDEKEDVLKLLDYFDELKSK